MERTSQFVTPVLKARRFLPCERPPRPCHILCVLCSPLSPPCSSVSPVHSLPFSTHLCPLPGGFPPSPEGLADAYFFKNEFTLLQEAGIWWLPTARKHREKAALLPPRGAEQKEKTKSGQNHPSARQGVLYGPCHREPAVSLAEHHRLCRLVFRRPRCTPNTRF